MCPSVLVPCLGTKTRRDGRDALRASSEACNEVLGEACPASTACGV